MSTKSFIAGKLYKANCTISFKRDLDFESIWTFVDKNDIIFLLKIEKTSLWRTYNIHILYNNEILIRQEYLPSLQDWFDKI